MRDRHVLITGGAGGLGTHVTAAMVRRGARVTVPVLQQADADRLVAGLGGGADFLTVCEADVRDEPQVRDLVQRMERLDAVVHLVGGFAMGETHTFDVALVREQLELNVVSTFIVLKHALVRMREADYGRIVTVASKSALQPTAQMAAYAAAKAGVLALTRAIADETRGTGITANCVLPSVIDTPANRRAMGEAEAGTWVQPWRLADTIAFLSSEAAGDLRGSALKAYANV